MCLVKGYPLLRGRVISGTFVSSVLVISKISVTIFNHALEFFNAAGATYRTIKFSHLINTHVIQIRINEIFFLVITHLE